MKYHRTSVEGVVVVELEERSDARGFFARIFDVDEFAAEGLDHAVAQANLSYNHLAGTMRGMHRQRPPHAEGKLVRCTAGAIADVVADVRPESATYGRHVLVELSAANRLAIVVPPYLAHGYLTLEDRTEVTYQVSGPYTPEGEEGFRHDDPQLGITWPRAVAVISDKDGSWPLLSSRATPS